MLGSRQGRGRHRTDGRVTDGEFRQGRSRKEGETGHGEPEGREPGVVGSGSESKRTLGLAVDMGRSRERTDPWRWQGRQRPLKGMEIASWSIVLNPICID